MASQRKTALPTMDEIVPMPRWAMVAFAARCARRVEPLFQAHWPDAPEEHTATIGGAITQSERLAAADSASRTTAAAARTAAAACSAASASAADFAAEAFIAHIEATDSAAATSAIAAAAAGTAVRSAAVEKLIVKATRLDFDRLRNAAVHEQWDDQTPVPPEFFGPLWPEGEPKGWPFARALRETPEQDKTAAPIETTGQARFAIVWDPEILSEEDYAELVEALGDLVRAEGGAGIERIHSRGFGVDAEAGVLL